MPTERRTIEIEVPLEFECSIDPGSPGYSLGPPERCYEGEGASIDGWRCDTVSSADEFDIGRQARVLLDAGYDNAEFGRRVVEVVLEKLGVDAQLQEQVERLSEEGAFAEGDDDY